MKESHGGSPDLEAEDYGPDETQGESVVAVDDVVGAHVLQVNLLFFEELQGLVHVLQTVDPHPPFGGFRLEEENKVLVSAITAMLHGRLLWPVKPV